MYPNPIPLNNGAEVINYDYRGPLGENGSKYVGPTDVVELGLAPQLSIKHSVSGVNTINETQRSLVRLDAPVKDAAGNRGTISCYVVLSIPRKLVTETDVTYIGVQIKNFLTATGYLAKLINGEI